MAKEAEAHADEDKARKDAVEARNLLDSTVYQAEKMAKDNKDKISEDDLKTLNEAVEAAQKVVADAKASKEDLEKAAQELNDKIMPIGAKMYENPEAEATAPDASQTTDEPTEGEVVDPEASSDQADKK